MPSDLSNYLATHYLIADPKPSKKRKRKQKDDSSGLIIADETESGWTRANRGDNDDEDENGSAVVAGTSAEFRRAKKSAWKPVGGSTSSNTAAHAQAQDTEAARAADAILASAAAADEDASDAPAVMMSDGTHAGLQSASAVAAQLEARRRAEREEYEREGGRKKGKGGGEAETIYRDATGRRVDVSMKRAELRREAAEAAAREAAKTEALRGDVQIEAARRRREELDDAKVMTVARHADDEDMNREMKEQVRWGDSMAQFIEPKRAAGGGGGGGGGGGKTRKLKGKPIYQGAWTPNRYGIRPGYRWDGVDRGNGFEAERFKAINRRERNKGLEYSWQMDE
ncbi:Pre-mRNA-splicing factor of RES complex-domain-containing protein [Daldinia decipiens]|uniref:Pre-mRNA-splicing factor of RES complex-domain-containing protein n=1 Tax=Daldinia decipiens TaxID=326647 RepID=UPI0020C52B2D|nr:Pre-mRNA-splicing factor of RES complex-domain-containing protein [Daldinia decipiens]KAI1659847.1 Pre-mRNA-splicing factor of RES complex-domain-containing protein [Daldinia decipiens]